MSLVSLEKPKKHNIFKRILLTIKRNYQFYKSRIKLCWKEKTLLYFKKGVSPMIQRTIPSPITHDMFGTQDLTANTGIDFDVIDRTNISCDNCIHYDDGNNDYCQDCSNYLDEYECSCHISPPCDNCETLLYEKI